MPNVRSHKRKTKEVLYNFDDVIKELERKRTNERLKLMEKYPILVYPVYHATPFQFDEFDFSKGKRTVNGKEYSDHEVFFTTDPIGECNRNPHRVIKARIFLNKVKEFDINRAEDVNYHMEFRPEKLKEEGYDSVHYALPDGTNIYSVFYPEQIEITDPGKI